MKHSIRLQLAAIFIALLTATIGLCWFVNIMFLQTYYQQNKKDIIIHSYDRLNDLFETENIGSDEFNVEFAKICNMNNLSVVVVNPSLDVIKSSIKDDDMLIRRLVSYIFKNDPNYGLDQTISQNHMNENDFKDRVLVSNEKYVVRLTMDPRMQLDYIELWGSMKNGDMILMRTAVESIRESVKIANRFLAYVGFSAVLICAFIIWFVTKRITNPILQLAEISDKMTHLDFEAKYTGGGDNEIGILGSHMNELSNALEETISELKTANNELKSDLKKKEEIDEMRKEFLSNVSHELKTPIALIQGYAEGLKEGINEDKESRDFYCEVIMDEADKMNKMVKNLLTLNQLEFGNDVVSMERFNITELIRNYIQSAEILIRQAEAEVHFEQEEPVYVWGDEFKTEEVFTNYFSNALHYVAGERKIDVTIEKRDRIARITVFNTGSPIPEESIDKLWTKFYKVDKARTREYGGSGVGLSIVKAIMESFHHDYGVCNYENGVAFWFELDCK